MSLGYRLVRHHQKYARVNTLKVVENGIAPCAGPDIFGGYVEVPSIQGLTVAGMSSIGAYDIKGAVVPSNCGSQKTSGSYQSHLRANWNSNGVGIFEEDFLARSIDCVS
jgi:hypothetical protein